MNSINFYFNNKIYSINFACFGTYILYILYRVYIQDGHIEYYLESDRQSAAGM